MMTLVEIGEKYETDKFKDDVNYSEPYLKYFEDIRNNKLNLLEIGVARGAGLLTWNEYFPNGNIWCMENFWKHSKSALETLDICKNNGINVYVGDQSSRSDMGDLIGKSGSFDIIIDDGGHTMHQQQTSLGFLFRYLSSGGIYVVEDLVTSYEGFGNGFHRKYPEGIPEDRKITTLDFLKSLESGDYRDSPFMSEGEFKYLVENISSCEVFENLGEWHGDPNMVWHSAMSVIVKK